ncbi:MAG: TonB-dependent receptor [Dysgonamonadaceae bacterium]|jgi:hypothetical protein|nr:TonB-dependent receptor [Dysgonamonadaceae bacterium]
MKRKIKITFVLFMLFSAFVLQQLSAQSIRVNGIVYEKEESPSIGATVNVKGTDNITVTDMDGKFSIITEANSTLVVSYIGFKKQEIPVNNQQHTNSPAIKYPTPGSGDAVNEMKEGFNRTQNITTNLLLSYEKSIEQHRFSVMGGYSYEGETYRWFNTGRTFDDMKYDALGDEVKSDAVANSGGGRDFVMNSFFGRFNYNYADRYLFEFNIRDDISSKFAKENRNAVFPSLSAAWRISEETFFEGWKNDLPNVKFRGSWGLVGNNRIDLYQYLERVKANQSYMFGDKLVNTAVFESSNPDIRWETTEMANIALDLGLLNNSLNLTLEYFNNTTRDILVTLPVSKVYGLKAPIQNGGIVNTRGWETSLEYRLKTGRVNHRFALNLSDSRNEVVDNRLIRNR